MQTKSLLVTTYVFALLSVVVEFEGKELLEMRDCGKRRAADEVPLERLYLVIVTLQAQVHLLVAAMVVGVLFLRGTR